MHARMASGLLLALGIADLAVLNLLVAPRLVERGRIAAAAPAALPERVAENGPGVAPVPAKADWPCPPPVAPVGAPVGAPSPSAVASVSEAAPDVTFEIREVRVPGGRAADLRRLAEALREPGSKRLLLRGHADRLGLAEQNLGLSRQRAEAVLRILAAFGAPVERVSIEALGDADPVSDIDTPLGWARNRRVQLLWR
jgi:outer membrane protein OmpA-like peptidoglycan-associated protein